MGPTHTTVLAGDRLKLTCEAMGIPKPSIIWAKDDINLELNQRIEVRFYHRLLRQNTKLILFTILLHSQIRSL